MNQNFDDTVIQFDDDVTITHGKHVFKAGFEMWRFRLNTFYSGNSGEYGSILFGGAFTGDPAGDFFTGYPGATGKGVSTGGTWHQLAWRFAGYGQDDWRITPTLTLNLGLRYEASTPWVELNNRQDNLNLVTGAIEYAGQDGNSRALYNSVYGLPDFQPRVGFAWSPAWLQGKTVLRGAYTISSYLEGTGTNLRLARNPPFTPTEVICRLTTRRPITRPIRTGRRGCRRSIRGRGLSTSGHPKVQPEMNQEWNLTVQSEASSDDDLPGWLRGRARNPPDRADSLLAENADGRGGRHPASTSRATPPCWRISRRFPGPSSAGFQTYHALQAVLQKRISNGLEGQVAYTWSHCMSNNSGYYGSWGSATQATPGIPTIRTCMIRMPITRAATLTRRTSSLPTPPMICRSARAR